MASQKLSSHQGKKVDFLLKVSVVDLHMREDNFGENLIHFLEFVVESHLGLFLEHELDPLSEVESCLMSAAEFLAGYFLEGKN